jgi:6-phosphogluconate dehydrogenase
MRFGIVGLGRMGSSIAEHAVETGHEVVGYSRNVRNDQELGRMGVVLVDRLDALVNALSPPRVVLIYVPHGAPTDDVCRNLKPLLSRHDIVVDGGNSHWEDSKARHRFFADAGICFLDVGTSGGVVGARHGACFMVGGEREAFETVRPLLRDLAIDEQAAFYAGAPGAGHFVKLIHNAIEFGMVQAIAEGVEMLQRSEFEVDLPGLFCNWDHGSVIRGWLVQLMGRGLEQTPDFSQLSTYVEDTGEVKWVVRWALENDIPTPIVSEAQQALMAYRDLDRPAAKAVALLRNQYGEHPVHKREPEKTRA